MAPGKMDIRTYDAISRQEPRDQGRKKVLFLLEHYWVLTGRNYTSLANKPNNGQSCFLVSHNWLRMSVSELKGAIHFFLLEICVTVLLILPRSERSWLLNTIIFFI